MKRIVILGVVVVVVIALWSAGWLFAANEARKAIEALSEDKGPGVPTLTCGTLDIGGYPFRLDVTCGPAMIGADDLTVTVAEVRATVLVYRLNQVLLFAKAPLTFEDAFSGAKSRLTWASFESSLRLVDWRIARFSMVAENLSWADTLATEALIANAGHLEFHLVDVPEKLDVAAHTSALVAVGRLTGLTAPAQEINAGDFEFQAEITGLPDQLMAFADPDALPRWQAAGGNVAITELKGEDGPNFLDVSGNIKLDAAGFPDGQIAVKSKGLVERFRTMIAPELQGVVLGQPAADGSYSQTLTMSGGVVMSGLLPVWTVPAIW